MPSSRIVSTVSYLCCSRYEHHFKVLLGVIPVVMTNYYRASELWFYNYFYFLFNFIYRYILIKNKAGIQLCCTQTSRKSWTFPLTWSPRAVWSQVTGQLLLACLCMSRHSLPSIWAVGFLGGQIFSLPCGYTIGLRKLSCDLGVQSQVSPPKLWGLLLFLCEAFLRRGGGGVVVPRDPRHNSGQAKKEGSELGSGECLLLFKCASPSCWRERVGKAFPEGEKSGCGRNILAKKKIGKLASKSVSPKNKKNCILWGLMAKLSYVPLPSCKTQNTLLPSPTPALPLPCWHSTGAAAGGPSVVPILLSAPHLLH